MRKILSLCMCFSTAIAAIATNYPGNGKTGFGGPVGPGSLDITNTADSITFKLIRGPGSMNDALVIYIDARAGGFATTAGFNDNTDGLTKAIAGYDNTIGVGTGRSVFNFSAAFRPEFALAFRPGLPSAKLVALNDTGIFTILSLPGLSNNTGLAESYTVKIKASDIGLGSCISFNFMATNISLTAYRSEEAIGDPMTGFVQGWNPYTSVTPPLTYLNCAAPAGLSVTNTTASSARLNWAAVPCAVGYRYQYRVKGTTAWRSGETSAFRRNISGLTAATTYQWKVLTGCRISPDTVASNFTSGPEFTTAAASAFTKTNDPGSIDSKRLSASLIPNPAVNSSRLKVNSAKGAYSVTITNMMGVQVWHSAGNTGNEVLLPVNKFNKGIYRVMVTDNERSISVNLVRE